MRKTDDDRLGASDIENAVRRSFLILRRRWWVVVLVFAITLGASYPSFAGQADIYVARTKLLIIAPASERLLGEADAPVLSLSAETLSALATANDLMQAIISDLALVDDAGRPWAVESLAGMLDSEVAMSGGGTRLPLITTTVRGEDPKFVARIANKWAESFAQKNSELFASEAAGSYEFAATQYEKNQEELRAVQAERLAYEQARQAERLMYEQAKEAERLAKLQVRQQERLAYERETPLTALKSQLEVLTAKYSDFLGELQAKRSALVAAQARLASVGEALAGEDPFLTAERRISSDAIWTILAGNPDGLTEEALSDLVLEDQEINDLYLMLKAENATLQSEIASLTAEIGHLETKTGEFEQGIESLTGQISRTELELQAFDQNTTHMFARFGQETSAALAKFDGDTNLVLFQLGQEINVLDSSLDRLAQGVHDAGLAKAEQAGSIRVVESAVEPRSPGTAGPGSGARIGLLVAVGLALGVAAAFLVHYVWDVLRSADDTESPRPADAG